MRRRRLLLTTDAVGGVWTYSIDLARALAKAEDMVVLLAILGPSPSPEQLTEAAAVPGLQVIDTGLPLDWTAASERDVRECGSVLAHLADQGCVDLVQVHTPSLAAVCFPVPVVSVIHSCVGTWWSAVHGGELPHDLAWRAALVRDGLERSDTVIAPSQSFAAAVQRDYALPVLPLAVVNGRGAPELAPPAAPARMAFTAGRLWDAGKNVAAFDRAAALSSLPFCAAGPTEGPDGSHIRLDHAEALGHLAGEDLAAILATRPIFVSAALYEPFGLAILEAAQAGCAMVLADRPVFRELWEDAACFVDPLDEHAIAAAVDRLAHDADEREELGRRAQARAGGYTPDRTAAAMLEIYGNLLSAPAKVAA